MSRAAELFRPSSLRIAVDEPAIAWVRRRYASFDGLRGVAILLVFLRHFLYPICPSPLLTNLWVGVDMFFVLSGFLITGILFDTVDEPNTLRNFYIRRALRIYPLYMAIFGLIFLAAALHRVAFSAALLTWPLYVANLVHPFLNMQLHNPDAIHFRWHARDFQISLGFFWSLCVEEQFYLIWPLVVRWARSRERLMQIALFGMALTLLLRLTLYVCTAPNVNQDLFYISPYTRCDALLAGAWCALWLRGVRLTRTQLHTFALRLGLPSATLLLLAVKLTGSGAGRLTPFLETWGFTLTALTGVSVLLFSLDDRSLLSRTLRLRPLALLGTISYGFYLLHDLAVEPLHRLFAERHTSRPHELLATAAWFLLCCLLSWLVFRFFELPFLRLKAVLAPSGHANSNPQVGGGGHSTAPPRLRLPEFAKV